jgi:hypothetical protein
VQRLRLGFVLYDPRLWYGGSAYGTLAVGGKFDGGMSWRQGWRRFSRDARVIVDDDKRRRNLAVDVRDLILQ